MAKLYVFGIGGTGSRVLRSLTMLMASGVKMGVDEVVPVIIDPDVANADLTRTVMLMNSYKAVRSGVTFDSGNESQFFRVRLTDLMQNYTLHVKDTNNKSFKDFIDYASMSKANQAMTKMLFSDHNLGSTMVDGFKGNPNIGSVVLNQITATQEFADFANSFSQGDKIFIISSIFGGTGASGFPLLLKTLRTGKAFPNNGIINGAEIGAVSILPYFGLKQDENSAIDSSTFISKAKSALAYYEKNISGNGSVNAFYFLADDVMNSYANNQGGVLQSNAAHLIEFLGATAIVDFANKSYQGNTVNKELGLEEIDSSISFASFYPNLRSQLYQPMVQFVLMMNSHLNKSEFFTSDTFAANSHFANLYTSNQYTDLVAFFDCYKGWLKEMQDNQRSLDLFNLDCEDKPFEVVKGVRPKKSTFQLHRNYELFANYLNSAVKKCKSATMFDKYLEMFYIATKNIIADKL